MRCVNRLVAYSALATVWLVVLTAQLPAQQPVDPLRDYHAGIETTPHGFLQAAANRAVARALPLGVEVGFMAGGRRYVGLLDESHRLDRVTTWVYDPKQGEVAVETFYRDYQRFGRVLFPRRITQDQARSPMLDLWVSAVEARHNKENR